jgi:hypothetical protein
VALCLLRRLALRFDDVGPAAEAKCLLGLRVTDEIIGAHNFHENVGTALTCVFDLRNGFTGQSASHPLLPS